VLGVHGFADRHGHAAQQVAALGQVAVVKAQQARHLAAAQHVFVQFNRRDARIVEEQLDLSAARELRGVPDRQGRRHIAQHQRLAAGHENAHRTIVGRDLRGLHVVVQVADQRVALVQQVVGALAVALRAGNLLVDGCDAFGQLVDLLHRAVQFIAHRALDFVQPGGGSAHAAGGFVDAREHQAARRQIGGGGHDIRERVDHVVDGSAQAGGAATEDVLQFVETDGPRRVGR